MPRENLDEREREVVRECLQAAVKGPFFPDWEFETLFGLTREEVGKVLLSWPTPNESDESVVQAILDKWKSRPHHGSDTALDFFDNMMEDSMPCPCHTLAAFFRRQCEEPQNPMPRNRRLPIAGGR